MRKQILFDARVLANQYPSGISLYTRELLSHLLRDGDQEFEFTLFFNAKNKRQHDVFYRNIEKLIENPKIYPQWYSNKLVTLSWRLFDYPKIRIPSDILHVPHINIVRKEKTPRIVTIHDLSYERFPHFLTRQDRLWHQYMAGFAKTADHFIADSYSTKEDLIKIWRVPSQKITVVYPGPIKSLIETKLDYSQSSNFFKRFDKCLRKNNYFLFVSTLEKRKNIPRLLQAFSRLIKKASFSDLQLVLVGSKGNSWVEIKGILEEHKLSNNVVITDYVSSAEKAQLFQNALAFVYPSLYEGFGLPLLEAMQHQLPILTTEVSSIPEVTGKAALFVNPYDVESIYKGLEKIISDTGLRKKLVQEANSQLKFFSWDKTVKKIKEVYRRF